MVLKFSFVNLCSLEIEQFPITLDQFPLAGLHKLTYTQSTFPTYWSFIPISCRHSIQYLPSVSSFPLGFIHRNSPHTHTHLYSTDSTSQLSLQNPKRISTNKACIAGVCPIILPNPGICQAWPLEIIKDLAN